MPCLQEKALKRVVVVPKRMAGGALEIECTLWLKETQKCIRKRGSACMRVGAWVGMYWCVLGRDLSPPPNTDDRGKNDTFIA